MVREEVWVPHHKTLILLRRLHHLPVATLEAIWEVVRADL